MTRHITLRTLLITDHLATLKLVCFIRVQQNCFPRPGRVSSSELSSFPTSLSMLQSKTPWNVRSNALTYQPVSYWTGSVSQSLQIHGGSFAERLAVW